MARFVENRDSPTEGRLLTCHLDTAAVAQKAQLRKYSLYWKARRPEETKVGDASVPARDRGRGVARFAESCPEN